MPPLVLVELSAANALLLAAALAAVKLGSRVLDLSRADEVAMVFCGAQKSLVTGVPMAQLLFAGPDAGIIVIPIMIYHQLQLLLGAWLARRYARIARLDDLGPIESRSILATSR